MLKPKALVLFLVTAILSSHAFTPHQEKEKQDKVIDEAIKKGVSFLKKQQQSKGNWEGGQISDGTTALSIYTLIRCKERLSDRMSKEQKKEVEEAIQKGIEYILGCKVTPNGGGDEQYAMSIHIMALEAHDKVKHKKKIQELVDLLIARQEKSGAWGYGDPVDPDKSGTTTDDKPKTKRPVRPDVSINQYVVLGLFAAKHGGIKIDTKIWEKALGWILKAQFPDGQWICCKQGGGVSVTGTTTEEPSDSKSKVQGINLNMTAAGLGTIALIELALERKYGEVNKDHVSAAKKKALEFLTEHWKDGTQTNREHQYQHFYYLYGIERSMAIMDKAKLGKDDWYYYGAEKLVLPHQKSDGSFAYKDSGGSKISITGGMTEHINLQTCFALLFLSRATEGFFTQ